MYAQLPHPDSTAIYGTAKPPNPTPHSIRHMSVSSSAVARDFYLSFTCSFWRECRRKSVKVSRRRRLHVSRRRRRRSRKRYLTS